MWSFPLLLLLLSNVKTAKAQVCDEGVYREIHPEMEVLIPAIETRSLDDIVGATKTKFNRETWEEETLMRGEKIVASVPDALYTGEKNALVATIVAAYYHHMVLELWPEDLLQALSGEVSKYVNAFAEELRHRFVAHKGKKELVVWVESKTDVDDFIQGIRPKLDAHLLSDIAHHLTPNFTTTLESDVVAANAVLMSTFQAYFRYTMGYLCGIPAVWIHGTDADWDLLDKKFQRVREIMPEMEPYFEYYAKVLDIIRRTRRGEATKEWDSVAVRDSKIVPAGSGESHEEVLSGWALWLDGYDKQGNLMDMNTREVANIQPSVMSTPFKLVGPQGESNATLYSGFFGFTVHEPSRPGQTHKSIRAARGFAAYEIKKEA